MATKIKDHPRALTAARRRASKPRKRGTGLTPRIKLALEHWVFGADGLPPAPTQKEAAERAGISDRALRLAILKPAVHQHYMSLCQALRDGERHKNIRTAIEIRDDHSLKGSAAGATARLKAAQQLDADLYGPAPINVGVQVNVETPGYVIDLSEYPAKPAGSSSSELIEHENSAYSSSEDQADA